jgi:hypothetical protein
MSRTGTKRRQPEVANCLSPLTMCNIVNNNNNNNICVLCIIGEREGSC